MNPIVSIILPAYNAEKYISKTITSVLGQSYTNFELIIIDDGSKDNTSSIVSSFCDSRIIYVKNESNLRLVKTLNKAIALARGKYIARIDADDICHPKRIESQVLYLQKFTDVAVVGTDIYFIDKDDNVFGRGVSIEESSSFIKWNFQRRCCLYHPSVMFNKEILGDDLYYDEKFINAEDYELWLRLSKSHQLRNINIPLLFYRVHDSSISQTTNTVSVRSMLLAIELYGNNWHEDILDSKAVKLIRFPNETDNHSSQDTTIQYLISGYKYFMAQNIIDSHDKSLIKESILSFYIISSLYLLLKFERPSLKALVSIFELKLSLINFCHVLKIFMVNIHRRFLWKYLYRKKSYLSYY